MMTIEANNPNLISWIPVNPNSDFPIQNIPFGIGFTESHGYFVCTRIGDTIINLKSLFELDYLNELGFELRDFNSEFLNLLMMKGKSGTRILRNRLSLLFKNANQSLQNNEDHKNKVLCSVNEVRMALPVRVGDYTDFYSSKEHATNVGIMFRDPANALLPNWLWIPVGYHGRSSSIIESGVPIHRPKGQTKADGTDMPSFGASQRVDFELEMGFLTYEGKPLGDSISTGEAEDFIFGMCLFNDWSARDIQQWEYVPLGPFLGKNFASSMSPWIVTLDALQPYAVESPVQNPPVLKYLQSSGLKSYDIHLEVFIQPENGESCKVSASNFKYMYWNMSQQLAHHTVNGCNIRCGDLMGSGTISGPTPDSYGSMLELAWKGTKPLVLSDGSERKFIKDGDAVIFKGFCTNGQARIGFGELSNILLPVKQ